MHMASNITKCHQGCSKKKLGVLDWGGVPLILGIFLYIFKLLQHELIDFWGLNMENPPKCAHASDISFDNWAVKMTQLKFDNTSLQVLLKHNQLPPDMRTPSLLQASVLTMALWPLRFCVKTPSGSFHCLMLSGDAEAIMFLITWHNT